MHYRDAIEIARQNPGFCVTRGGDGEFVVLRPDGSVVDAPTDGETERDRLAIENARLRDQYENVSALLDEATAGHRAEIAGLEAKLEQLRVKLQAEQHSHSSTSMRLAHAEAKLAKVSQNELDRIKLADEAQREERAAELREERRVINCPCRGEVENCPRCCGRGTYTTDGYGNIV